MRIPEDEPWGLPRDPDPYYAFDESLGPSLRRRKRISCREPFPVFATVVVVLFLGALVILGSYLVGGMVSLVRK